MPELVLRLFGLVLTISLGRDEEPEETGDTTNARYPLSASVERVADGTDPAFGFGRHWWEETE